MKKKLLIFMLVLGMASVSQATMCNLYIGGETEIVGTAGSTYTVELIADLKCFAVTELMVAEVQNVNTDNQGTSWSAGEAVAGTISALPTVGAGMTISEAGYLEDKGILFDWFSEYSVDGVAAGTILASFSYTIPTSWLGTEDYWIAPLAPGTAYIDILGDPYTAGASSASLEGPVTVPIGGVHIIPEPATIALLGLGGLFLRRRK